MHAPPASERLHSLDALRGFDMFWIIGGREVFAGLAALTGWGALEWWVVQCTHVEWHGFRFWDLIFPLFLFIAGVAMPFSLTRLLERGAGARALHLHVIRRGLLLVFLGVVYNGLLTFDFADLRYASVLGRIGLGYLGAGLVVLHCGRRGQVLWIAGLLLGYWAALALAPVPGIGPGVLEPGQTLSDWIDRQLLPGRLHRGVRDPEGLLATFPAVATALLGALTGHALRAAGRPTARTAGRLALSGLAALALGGAWHFVFPINKNLWTSSFVLWTAGWSLLLLAAFHLLVDVWHLRRPFFVFTVIGLNPLTIYLLQAFVDFDAMAAIALRPEKIHAGLSPLAGFALRWAFLYWLYRRRIFLRI